MRHSNVILPGHLLHRAAAFTLAVCTVLLSPIGHKAGQCAESLAAEAAGPRPNIVFILVDDLGWADVGSFGSDFYETPHIDRLARQGMRLTRAYAACPVCSPTRASILTGKYPARLKLTNFIPGGRQLANARVLTAPFRQQLPLEEVTLAETLAAAGYTCGHVGKWHLGDRGFLPRDQGFHFNCGGCGAGGPADYFYPQWTRNIPIPEGKPGEYLPDRLAEEAVGFIERNKDRPFFLHYADYAVHIPMQAPEDRIQKCRAKAAAHPGTRQDNPVYAAMVGSTDRSVGRLMETLDRLKIADRTIVFFFSDNGGEATPEGPHTPATTNWPLRAGKGYLYEGGIREPAVVRWPGVVRPGSECAAVVSSIDFYPTILEMAGAAGEPGHTPDGVSLVPLLKETGTLKRDAIYWHYPHFSNQGGMPGGAVRQGPFKLIRFYEDERVELYDVEKDIGEKEDLAQRMPEKAAELRGLLDKWLREVDATMCPKNPEYDPTKPLGGPLGPKVKPQPKTKP